MSRVVTAMLVAVGIGTGSAADAQTPAAEPKLGWKNDTELSWVVATGNAEANTVGLRNVYAYDWAEAKLSWEAAWVRAASRDGDRFAVVGESGGFDVVEPGTAIDSQRLLSKLRYQRQISGRHDWFANWDSTRDEPSNINHIFVLAGGLGTTWSDSEQLTFRTSYGITFTDEDLVIEGASQFGGYRLFYGLKAKVTATASIESELTADGSFETADDIRTDWLNGVSVSLNSNVALKSSLRMLFRNIPALEEIDLELPGVGVVVGTVEVPNEKIDLSFSTSLVIRF